VAYRGIPEYNLNCTKSINTSCATDLRNCRAFSLPELLVVLVVIMLLSSVAVPQLAKFMRTSNVAQATREVVSVLWRASGEAQRMRKRVAVVYGEEPSRFVKPDIVRLLGGVWSPVSLPLQGKIEMWTVRPSDGGMNKMGAGRAPYAPEYGGSEIVPLWYPYRYQIQPLIAQPITLPTGIRVVAGYYRTVSNGDTFDFPSY
jgi:prepilin-type N-terminal cleavage/methylation domain-containing protein